MSDEKGGGLERTGLKRRLVREVDVERIFGIREGVQSLLME
jgi:hypothetical protein